MINPCPINVPCVPCADGNPLAGNSSEAPDEAVFTGISFQSPPLPLGAGFQAVGCVSLAQSTVSLEDAELLAEVAAFQCAVTTWTIGGPGGNPNPPAPPPQGPGGGEPLQSFLNSSQTGSADCPDGTEFFWTTPAGLFFGTTQAIADAKAQSYATNQAKLLMTCLSALPAQVCVNTAFNQMITASGMDANEGANNWELLSGMLPPSVSFSGAGTVGTFSGTVTTPGIYDFSIGVTGMDGGHVQKFYTVAVAGITDTLPQATTGTVYNGALTTAGFSAPTFALASGSLPDGLTLNADGTVTGTPASDAVTSTFTVAITDGVTGFVCMEDVIIDIAAPSFSWDNIVWDDPQDLVQGDAVGVNNGGNVSLTATSVSPQDAVFSNSNSNNQLSYTGPAVNCHLHMNITAVNPNFGGTRINVVHSDAGLIATAGDTAPNVFDVDFTIPDSDGATILVSYNGQSRFMDGLTSFTGTLTVV